MIVVDVAIIHQEKILLVDYRGACWIFPGGTLEIGEEEIDCLQREVLEEIGIKLPLQNLFFMGEFIGTTHDGEKPLTVQLYGLFADLSGIASTEGKILAVRWASVSEAYELNLSAMTRQMVVVLKEKGYL